MHSHQNKNFGIFGLGLTGKATYQFLKNIGHNVICYDNSEGNINSFIKIYGNQDIKDLSSHMWRGLDQIIVSPGIVPAHSIFKIAAMYNIQIISDIELLHQYNQNSFFIGITGTNGKSTTTALTAHILQNANIDYPACGNIGIPALSLPNQKGYTLELSSFQIDLFKNIKFNIAAILNITPDHLDRYITMENYIQAKMNIFSFLTPESSMIINVDNSTLKQAISPYLTHATVIPFSVKEKQKHGVAVLRGQIHDNISSEYIIALPVNKALQGNHNMENIAASYAMCRLLNLAPEKITKAIQTFKGLAHRMQYLGTASFTKLHTSEFHGSRLCSPTIVGSAASPLNSSCLQLSEFGCKSSGIHFYNDSKATNVDAASKSIAALDNIYWLAGGRAKEENLDGLIPYFSNIKKAYLYGEAKKLFAKSLNGKIDYVMLNDLEEAFNRAYQDAKSANKVSANILLAPACSSYDQFKNFEERGDLFIQLYEKLK